MSNYNKTPCAGQEKKKNPNVPVWQIFACGHLFSTISKTLNSAWFNVGFKPNPLKWHGLSPHLQTELLATPPDSGNLAEDPLAKQVSPGAVTMVKQGWVGTTHKGLRTSGPETHTLFLGDSSRSYLKLASRVAQVCNPSTWAGEARSLSLRPVWAR